MKKRLLSMLLVVVMMMGMLPITNVSASGLTEEIGNSSSAQLDLASRGTTVSRILTKDDFAYGGLSAVPSALSSNKAFMNAYVYNGNRLNLNGSFKKVASMNNESGGTLPTGTIKGESDGKWYATYQWTPTAEEVALIKDGFLEFEAGMIPDEHSHGGFLTKKTWHWSNAGIRISLPNEDGTNSWEYGVSDYARDTNGEWIYTDGTSEKNDGQPQLVDSSAGYQIQKAIESGTKTIFLNAYQIWDRVCGRAAVTGTVFYVTVGGAVNVGGVKITDQNGQNIKRKQRLVGGAEYDVTLDFQTEIRFADNKAHDDIKLILNAEYLEQSGMYGSFDITADFVKMTETTMTFRFKVDQSWKHFKITGIDKEQPDFAEETELLVYDSQGEPLDAVKLTSPSIIVDLYGNPMWDGFNIDWYTYRNFGEFEFDGISPTLNKVDMSGTGITVNAEVPDSWNSNAGSRADIFAGADGDTYSFALYFSENISVANKGGARAVLSITDEYGNPIELSIKSVSNNCIQFNSFKVNENMLDPGERVKIDSFKNLTVTDNSGNPLATSLTGNAILPAQEIYLDVDAPVVTSDQTLKADVVGERFSYPVKFADTDKGADNSGIAGKDASFRLEIGDGTVEYPYKWYMDTTQAIRDTAKWYNGVTGSDNVFKDITDGRTYWIHFALDPSIDYGYTVDNGIKFNGKLVVNGLTDWAGNVGDSVEYDLVTQVDTVKPTMPFASSITSIADLGNNSVSFSASIGGEDNYAVSALYYRWEKAIGGGAFEPIGDDYTKISVGNGTLLKRAAAEVSSYTYTFDGNNESTKYGQVRLKLYSEDTMGRASDVVTSDAISFNFQKAANASKVETNTAADYIKTPVVTMAAPIVKGETANRSVSMLIIPDVRTMENGEYKDFWVWIPWETTDDGWESAYDVYYGSTNPIASYLENYNGVNGIRFLNGLYYRVSGSVDVANAKSNFGDTNGDGRLKLNTAKGADMTDEEWAVYEEAQKDLYDYLTNYYGKMELYTVATSSLDYDNSIPNINFRSEDSVIDTFTVYLMNNAEYNLTKPVIRNEKGLTDAEVADGEAWLYYVADECRPGRVDLDNVSVSVQLTNVSDATSIGGVSYGLEHIDFANSTFQLYYTGSKCRDYDYLKTWYIDDKEPLKTWNLVKSSDGVNTIVFDKGLCEENGWYALAIYVVDRDGNVISEQLLGSFFMDATMLDITIDSYDKNYNYTKYDSDIDLDWHLDGLETTYNAGGEIKIGLAPLPENWEIFNLESDPDFYLSGHKFVFTSYGRPDGINDRGYYSDDLARIRVYNQTFNAKAGLAKDAGLWKHIASDTTSEIKHRYEPYLADPATAANPYGDENGYLLPFVDGENLIVYEIQASNGLVTTKNIVIYVEADPLEWELKYEINFVEGTENALNVTVWPEATDGSVLELYTKDADGDAVRYYEQGKNQFREYGTTYFVRDFVESYTYSNAVDNKEYIMMDALGNISFRTLTIYNSQGELQQFDDDPPYHTDFNSYARLDENGNPMYDSSGIVIKPIEIDSYRNGDTFHLYLYTYDSKNWIDINDIYLSFDAEYSALLRGGEKDEQGRLTMKVPVALDADGEPLKDENGKYAVWESTDPIYNGIYRTRVRDYGGDADNPGYVAVDIWGTWMYNESLESSERTIWVSSADIYGNRQELDGYDASNDQFNPPCSSNGYELKVGALRERDNNSLYFIDSIHEKAIVMNALNDDGTVGFYTTVPFHSISGWGVGEAQELEFYSPPFNDPINDWAPEGRYYYYTAPMIYKDGTYDFTVTDVFGKEYTLPLKVDVFGEPDVDVEFSTTEPTNKPVTVYFTAMNEYDTIVSIVADDGTEGMIDSDDPTIGAITVADNCTITVTTEWGYEREVHVTNIDKVLEEATIVYYDQNYRPLDNAMGASKVIAVLTCSETIFAMNGDESYTFTEGAVKGDQYTFEYCDMAGNTGSVTAELPIDLRNFEDSVPAADTLEPDVTMSLYLYRMGEYTIFERQSNPTQADDGESKLTAELNSEAYDGVRTRKYRLAMNIEDDSAYKVIVVPADTAAPADYASATQGCTVEGVSMTVGKNIASLEITKNTVFDVYVMDEEGNTAAFTDIKVTRISNTAPVLSVEYQNDIDEDGYAVIKAYFNLAQEDQGEEITPISGDIETAITASGIRYYHTFTANGSYTFEYMDSAGNRGSVTATVSTLSNEATAITSVSWYGTKNEAGLHNVTPDVSVPVNKDVTVQLRMSKTIRDVELYKYNPNAADGFGELLDENVPIEVNFTAGVISVTYTENVDYQVIVQFTASASGRKGSYTLPVVACIDKTAPVITPESREVADDKQSISFTFKTNEEAVFTTDSEKGFAMSHNWVCSSDKPVTLYFVDKAGNRGSIEVTDFSGMDRVKLMAEYSASNDGANSTEDPVRDLTLSVGGSFYLKVNKDALCLIGGVEYETSANEWTKITLPASTGIHILKFTDKNTGKVTYETVCALPKDNIAPVIAFESESVLVYASAAVEEMMEAIHSGVVITDNVDNAPTFTVTGYPASPAEGGLYTLTYTATDAFGNKSKAERTLYIMDEEAPMLLINNEVGLPYGKVFTEMGETTLELRNITDGQPVVIKYRKGIYTTGQMKYYAETVDNMTFETTERGHYTIYVRTQDRQEFVTYLYVEG